MGIQDLFLWLVTNGCNVRFCPKPGGDVLVVVYFDDKSGHRMAVEYTFMFDRIMNSEFPFEFYQVFERFRDEIKEIRKAK